MSFKPAHVITVVALICATVLAAIKIIDGDTWLIVSGSAAGLSYGVVGTVKATQSKKSDSH